MALPNARARDHLDGGYPGRHRPRLVRQLHHGAAQGAARARQATWSIRTNSPSRPARSRSTGLMNRSASRINTSRLRRHDLLQFLATARSMRGRRRFPHETMDNLEDNLLLFFTGYSRRRRRFLKEQDTNQNQHDRNDRESALRQGLGQRSLKMLETGQLGEFGRLMDVHWQHKKRRSSGMSNPKIDEWYDLAMENGAPGGKLIGAGGGGFLMFYAEDKAKAAPRDARAAERKCASVLILRAPKLSAETITPVHFACGNPGRRACHPPAAHHLCHSQDFGVGRRRAVCFPSIAVAAAAWRFAGSDVCWISRRAGARVRRRRRPVRPRCEL